MSERDQAEEQTQQQVLESLERCAEQDIDITDAVYAAFFSRNAQAQQLMGNSDQYMRGRMLEQVLALVMDEAPQEQQSYLRWELENHLQAYAVQLDMYADFLAATQQAVREALTDHWHDGFETAWSSRLNTLLNQIHREARGFS